MPSELGNPPMPTEVFSLSFSVTLIPFSTASREDPPELITKFVRNWENGYDFVYGTRDKRQELFVMRFIRSLFYKLINIGSNNKIPMNISDCQLIDKRLLKEIGGQPHILKNWASYKIIVGFRSFHLFAN